MDKLDRIYSVKIHIEAMLSILDAAGNRAIPDITGDQLASLLNPIQEQLHRALLELGYLKA